MNINIVCIKTGYDWKGNIRKCVHGKTAEISAVFTFIGTWRIMKNVVIL